MMISQERHAMSVACHICYLSKTAIAFQKHGCHGKYNFTHSKPKFHDLLHLMSGFSLSHTNICGFRFGCMEIDHAMHRYNTQTSLGLGLGTWK